MLTVEPIENGTVIDHIRAGKGKKVLDILGINEDFSGRVALVMNVPSKKLGKKDIVKIADKFVSEEQANLIALISPSSSINIIKNGKVIEKREVEVPEQLKSVGLCPNPNCITNSELSEKKFSSEKNNYRCYYCERLFKAEELI